MQAGARHCADVNGVFSGTEWGGVTTDANSVAARVPSPHTITSAPLATRAVMTLDTVAVLARICGCTVSEFVERYAA